jgi:GntR family transcriptional regulator
MWVGGKLRGLSREDVNKDGSTPIYSQVEALILDMIETGKLSTGERAPSEREVATSLGISRMTARAAISKLVSDGYLHTVAGKGTFVSDPKLRQDLLELTSFTEDMLRRGLRPDARLLGLEVADQVPLKVRRTLGVSGDSELISVRRLRTADGHPMCLETSYLPRAKVPWLLEEDLQSGSLYRILESRGIELAKAEEHLEATLATEEESELLTVPAGSPALLIERITYTDRDEPIEYVKSLYRGDRYRFSAMLFKKRKKGGGS